MTNSTRECPFSDRLSIHSESALRDQNTRMPRNSTTSVIQCCSHRASTLTRQQAEALRREVIGVPGLRCGGDLARCELALEQFREDPRAADLVGDHPGSGEAGSGPAT